MSNLLELNKEIKENFNIKQNLSSIISILKKYNNDDWKEYVVYNDIKYNRIRIFLENDFEIILICWKKGQRSKIHDHPENGCVLRLLHGKLNETRYTHTSETLTRISENKINIDNISYIKGTIGLHDIEALEDSVSLHIYSPPLYVPNIIDF
jgi:cysteine dioxygenase